MKKKYSKTEPISTKLCYEKRLSSKLAKLIIQHKGVELYDEVLGWAQPRLYSNLNIKVTTYLNLIKLIKNPTLVRIYIGESKASSEVLDKLLKLRNDLGELMLRLRAAATIINIYIPDKITRVEFYTYATLVDDRLALDLVLPADFSQPAEIMLNKLCDHPSGLYTFLNYTVKEVDPDGMEALLAYHIAEHVNVIKYINPDFKNNRLSDHSRGSPRTELKRLEKMKIITQHLQD